MKSVLIILHLLLIAITHEASSLGLDVDSTQILGSKDQFRVQLKPKGGTGPYTIFCTRKPAHWVSTERYVLAPKPTSNIYNQVLISVVIRDQAKNQFATSLVFILNNVHMLMDTVLYGYNEQMALPPITYPASSYKLQLERTIKDILQRNIGGQGPALNFGEVFQSTLMPKDLKEAFATMNVLAIIKAIGTVATTELNCIQQLSYLSQLSAIAYQSIKEKTTALQKSKENLANQLKSSEPVTQGKNSNTDESIYKTNQLIYSLETSATGLKAVFFARLQELQSAYTKFITISNFLDTNMKKAVDYSIQIDNVTKQIDDIYAKIYEIGYRAPLIASAVEKEQVAKIREALAQNNTALNITVNELRSKKKEQDIVIAKINEEQDSRKLQIKNLESQIMSLQSRLSLKYNELLHLYHPLDQSDSNFMVLAQNGYFLNIHSAAEVNSLFGARADIQFLHDIISYIGNVVDQTYFVCYGVKNARAVDQRDLFVYEIPYRDFMSYVRSFYKTGNDRGVIFASNLLPDKKIELQRVNVLSSIWTKKFGQALYLSSKGNNAIRANTASCLPPQDKQLQVFMGIISNAQSNVVQVRMGNGDLYYILLGACSRIEMTGRVLPEVGNLVMWRGIKVSDKLYDSYFTLIL